MTRERIYAYARAYLGVKRLPNGLPAQLDYFARTVRKLHRSQIAPESLGASFMLDNLLMIYRKPWTGL